LRRLASRLADAAVSAEVPRLDFARLPETANLLADTRFLVACAVVPRGQPLFRWQEDASGHAGRAGSLEQWIAQARPTIAKLLPGCIFECLLPDAYYVNCRESDRRVRPFGLLAQLTECGVTEVKKLTGTFTPEYCEDCGAPLFANAEGEIVHAELPEEADTQTAHFH